MKALVLLLVSGVAAADTYRLSEIRTPPRIGVADGSENRWPCGFPVVETITGTMPELVTRGLMDGWLRGDDDLIRDEPTAFVDPAPKSARERLVVTAHGAELQRAFGSQRARIPLHVVAHVMPGIDVYAYRANDIEADAEPHPAIFLLTTVDDGDASLDSDAGQGGVRTIRGISRESSCGILATKLRVIDGNSRVGQMIGRLRDGRSFFISASVSKTSRDREPILSVSVRR
jgi:hypothetical protein